MVSENRLASRARRAASRKPLAHICFALRSPQELTADEAYRILTAVIRIHKQGAGRRFRRGIAFIEWAHPGPQPQILRGERAYLMPVRVELMSRKMLNGIIDKKHRDERPENRPAVSWHPPELYRPDTLLIAIGSRGFLGSVAVQILNRNQRKSLLQVLNDVHMVIHDLEEALGGEEDMPCYAWHVTDPSFYVGNVNTLLHKLTELQRAEERERGARIARRLNLPTAP